MSEAGKRLAESVEHGEITVEEAKVLLREGEFHVVPGYVSPEIRDIREAHTNDCRARGVHDAGVCARTAFTEAQPACPDQDEHTLLDEIDRVLTFKRGFHEAVQRNARMVADYELMLIALREFAEAYFAITFFPHGLAGMAATLAVMPEEADKRNRLYPKWKAMADARSAGQDGDTRSGQTLE